MPRQLHRMCSKMNPEIEQAVVSAFVQKGRQDRALFELRSKKKRGDFFNKLSRFDTVLDARFMEEIPPPNSSADDLTKRLQELGAPETCYVLSSSSALDGFDLPLSEAMRRTVGMGLPSIISCIPGALAYFEAEQVAGPPPRFVLQRR